MIFIVEKLIINDRGVGSTAISAGFWLKIDLEKGPSQRCRCATFEFWKSRKTRA
jgi:hypothetical protein